MTSRTIRPSRKRPFSRLGKGLMQAALVTIVALLAVVLVGIWIRLSDLREEQTRLLDYELELLTELVNFESAIGYGGMIHNFKNAILRPHETIYTLSAEVNLQNARLALDRIDWLLNTLDTPVEMEPIREVLEQYAAQIELIRGLDPRMTDPAQTDLLVRIYDNDALMNLSELIAATRSGLVRQLDIYAEFIDRLTDWFALAAALLVALVVFAARIHQLEGLEIKTLAGRQTEYLLDRIEEGVIGLSENRDVIFLNAPARRLLGVFPGERNFPWPKDISLVENSSDDRASDLVARASNGENLSHKSGRLTRPDGRSFLVRFSCQRVYDDYPHPVVSIIILMHMTELDLVSGQGDGGRRPHLLSSAVASV